MSAVLKETAMKILSSFLIFVKPTKAVRSVLSINTDLLNLELLS